MTVDLDKSDLACLVKGKTPPYSVYDHPIVKKSGKHIGGMSDRWDWNYGFEKDLSESELYELHIICKRND